RGARQPGRPRHLTQGELGMLRIERADDGEPSLQGLHEIGADAPVDPRGRRAIHAGHVASVYGVVSASASRAMLNARLARGTPAYTATWRRTSLISSTLTPFRRAARTCKASSCSM